MKTKMLFLILLALILTACGDSDCKNGEECNKLAWEYWNKEEFRKAFKIFEKACNLENFEACWHLGHSYDYGIEAGESWQKAKKYYQKAFELANKFCEKDDYKACYLLGTVHFTGLVIARQTYYEDKTKGRNLLKKACELGYYKSCIDLVEIKYFFTPSVVTQEELEYYKKAFGFAKEACEKDDYTACFSLSTLYKKIGMLEMFRLNKEWNEEKIYELYQKGFELARKECLAGDYYKACSVLGNFYRNEGDELQDIPKAIETYEKACGVHNLDACWSIVNLVIKERDENAKEILLKQELLLRNKDEIH